MLNGYKDLLLNKEIDFHTKPFYITLATPHSGSKIANKLIVIKNKHKQIKTLKTDSNILLQLNTKFIEKKEQYNRQYYYGLDDQIVDKESSCSEKDECHRVAVKGNHVSICKPDKTKESETLLHDINTKIKLFLNIKEKSPLQNKSCDLVSLVLFDSVNKQTQPYYLKREIDNRVNKIIKIKNVWIYGESGVGKTNIVQYYLLTNDIDFFHSTYYSTPKVKTIPKII